MKQEKQPNQNGELTSDQPGRELVKPSLKLERYISQNKAENTNTTAKDPNLGNRNVTR